MNHIVTSIDASDILIVAGFILLVTGVALYALPVAVVVAGVILFGMGLFASVGGR